MTFPVPKLAGRTPAPVRWNGAGRAGAHDGAGRRLRSSRRLLRVLGVLMRLGAALLASTTVLPGAPTGFHLITGRSFDAALPRDFYLEGNAIPTEKRNARLVETPRGRRLLIALIDTTGYSSQVQKKYIGMLITEGEVSLCGHRLGIGSYGFGLEVPPQPSGARATFHLYDQAGNEVFRCQAGKDLTDHHPRPLEVRLGPGAGAELYLGRYHLELEGR